LKIAVVGAGIVGSSVAYRLSQRGAEVVLIDRAEPGSGTTSASFAWVNANNKLPRDYFELNVAGMREHEWLRDEIGGDWLHPTGNLIWAAEEEQENLERRVERLRAWSYAAEMLPASTVYEKLEPGAVIPDPRVAHFPEESWVDAPALTRTLVQAASRNGATTLIGDAVHGIEVGGEGVTLRLENSDAVHADAMVNATGARAASMAKMVGRELPLDVFRGCSSGLPSQVNLCAASCTRHRSTFDQTVTASSYCTTTPLTNGSRTTSPGRKTRSAESS